VRLFIVHGGLASASSEAKKALACYQQHFGGVDAADPVIFYTGNVRSETEGALATWLEQRLADASSAVRTPIPCFVFGGDGTLNLVVQQLHRGGHQQDFILVPVPLGTGNDAARRFNIKTWRWFLDAGDAVDRVALRYGQINDRIFINSTGVGLSADLVAAQSHGVKRYFGKLSYTLAALAWLLKPRAQKLLIDGKGADVLLLSIGVGQYCGGGIKLHPNAARAIAQHQLSVVRIAQVPRYLHPWYLLQVLRARHPRCRQVTETFPTQLGLSAADSAPIMVEVDGDLLTQIPANLPTQVYLSEQSIDVYVPSALSK